MARVHAYSGMARGLEEGREGAERRRDGVRAWKRSWTVSSAALAPVPRAPGPGQRAGKRVRARKRR